MRNPEEIKNDATLCGRALAKFFQVLPYITPRHEIVHPSGIREVVGAKAHAGLSHLEIVAICEDAADIINAGGYEWEEYT